jgi:hypothetical protein
MIGVAARAVAAASTERRPRGNDMDDSFPTILLARGYVRLSAESRVMAQIIRCYQ